MQYWANIKGVSPEPNEASRISELSEQLAFDLWQIKYLRPLERVSSLFGMQGMLDADSPFVKRMCAVCEARLLANGMVAARSRRT